MIRRVVTALQLLLYFLYLAKCNILEGFSIHFRWGFRITKHVYSGETWAFIIRVGHIFTAEQHTIRCWWGAKSSVRKQATVDVYMLTWYDSRIDAQTSQVMRGMNVMALLGVNNTFQKLLCVTGTFFKHYRVMRNINVRRYGKFLERYCFIKTPAICVIVPFVTSWVIFIENILHCVKANCRLSWWHHTVTRGMISLSPSQS